MRLVLLLGFLNLVVVNLHGAEAAGAADRAPDKQSLIPTAAQQDVRLGWWREARFGMFIHWGVYSALSGSWQGKNYNGYGEHIQRMAKIPIPVYRDEVAGTFNPTSFDADAWAELAKQAGMGYLIITAKHHDGFAMYDSHVSDYNVVKATPFHRDPMIELRDACRKRGIRFGFYYSHAFDWGDINAPGNDWDYQNPGGDLLLHGKEWWRTFPEFLPTARRYVDTKAIPQIRELIATYDPDILWFDTPHKLPLEENLRILAAVRAAKPTLAVNGRLVSNVGDYDSTTDMPAEFPPQQRDWEAIPTTNNSYGYNRNDHSHKPPAHFIQLLAKAAARGGNLLLNIGPMGDGRIDQADIAILQGIGGWWNLNGQSIRGTTKTPLAVQAWGESTRKGNTLYLHVFTWPTTGELIIGGLKTGIAKAYLLSSPGTPLTSTRQGLDVHLAVPTVAPDAVDSVVVVECKGEPLGDPQCLLSATGTNTLRALDAEITSNLAFGSGNMRESCVMGWLDDQATVTWPTRLIAPATFAVSLTYDAPKAGKRKMVEGDAGVEVKAANPDAGGTFTVTIADQMLEGTVQTGKLVTQPLGTVTLKAGACPIIVRAKTKVAKAELFRLRTITLSPVEQK